jgi:hypothetical protein
MAVLVCFLCLLLLVFFGFYPCFIGVRSVAQFWLRPKAALRFFAISAVQFDGPRMTGERLEPRKTRTTRKRTDENRTGRLRDRKILKVIARRNLPVRNLPVTWILFRYVAR